MDEDTQNLLEPEFAPHYDAWQKTKTPETSATLLKAINPVLTAAVRQFGTKGSPTLHSRAKIMAINALGRYDPSKAKMRTYLMSQLQGLRRYTAKEQQILSVPEQVGLDAGHVRNAENELRDQLGRDPSDMELSDYTKLAPKRLAYIRKIRPAAPEGIFHKSTDEGDDIYSPPIAESPNMAVHWQELVYHDLSPIDQVIMEHTLALHSKPVLQNIEIARKLNISPGAVSQRKARIQQKLDLRDELRII